MLAHDLIETLAEEKHELILNDIRPLPSSSGKGFKFIEFDITDKDRVYNETTKINPDMVIHTAACTDVDGCEKDADLAFKVNSLGTRNIALACQRFDTVMLYVSTDYVFDGKGKEPYNEYKTPNPENIYARSKYWGELYVERLLNKFYIVRSAWLYGKYGENFASKILSLAKKQKEISVVNDQIGSPTYTKDLAKAIKHLIGTGLYGTWHITNGGQCSWYEFAKEILKQQSIKNVTVKPIDSVRLSRPAKRPAFSVLDNYLWHLHGFSPLRNWKDALIEFMGEI